MKEPLSKRDFLRLCGRCLFAIGTTSLLCPVKVSRAQGAQKGLIKVKESPYYKKLNNGAVQCELCPRQCLIPKDKRGFCGVRENRNGRLYSLVYGNPCVIHLDPVEKEPFFHILPGSSSLTLSTAGCNFQCMFCENWEISRAQPEDVFGYDIPPSGVIKKAIEMNARSISFTYAEPTVFYEYMFDVAYLSKKAGILNYIHTNGFINPEPLRNLCGVLDAAQVDLKGFTESFYDELTGGMLSPVLKSLKILREKNIHLEITNLIIPTKNDSLSGIRKMCQWIKKELGPDTPLHFHRFYPLYRLQRISSTPITTLENARSIALETGLKYVYIGRIPGHDAWNTYCPSCNKAVIQRTGYMIDDMNIKKGGCEFCGETIYGKWD